MDTEEAFFCGGPFLRKRCNRFTGTLFEEKGPQYPSQNLFG